MASLTTTPLVAIVGPTASGKSALALSLAERYNGEIICADSQTIRREMTIGTAKPTAADIKRVPHHLIDIIDPYEPYNVAQFKSAAETAIEDIEARGKVPFLVGGTGLYVDAVLFDFAFLPPGKQKERKALEELTVEQLQVLHAKKGRELPVNSRNKRHLIRSLEAGGTRNSDVKLRPHTVVLGVDVSSEILQKRISKRIEAMFEQGWMKEVQGILNEYGPPPDAWDAIGYKLIADWLSQPHNQRASEKDLREKLLIATRQYAKRQRTWFRRRSQIQWVSTAEEADSRVGAFLERQ